MKTAVTAGRSVAGWEQDFKRNDKQMKPSFHSELSPPAALIKLFQKNQTTNRNTEERGAVWFSKTDNEVDVLTFRSGGPLLTVQEDSKKPPSIQEPSPGASD